MTLKLSFRGARPRFVALLNWRSGRFDKSPERQVVAEKPFIAEE
jgi:hypothetical protein